MRAVWKFPLEIIDEPQRIDVSFDSEVVHVGAQGGQLCIWIELDLETAVDPKWFTVEGTGHPIPDNAVHRGSVIMPPFVWHVYEVLQ